ncbi:septum formation initiator family protein [bacterium]|nr:septum formation initiator family protein [bacterium]
MADWSRITRITLLSLLGAGVIVYAVWFYYGEGGLRDHNRLRATFAEQKLEIARLELQKQELSSYLEAVRRGDRAALELAARRYGLVAQNEYLWKIVPLPTDSTNE